MDIGWFSTGRDAAARELLSIAQSNINRGIIKGKIIFTFSNREPGESQESDLYFELVQNLKIPLISYSSKAFNQSNNIQDIERRRLLFDREVIKRISHFKPDICILAGYMLIVGKEMCKQYDMINLHPALPDGPKGSWQDVIWELIEKKYDSSGVMMHLVTPDLDRGPVISYCKYPLSGNKLDKYWQEIDDKPVRQIKAHEGENNNLFRAIREQGLLREFPLIILTLKSLGNKEVCIVNKKIIDSKGNNIKAYDLTEQVNQMIGLK